MADPTVEHMTIATLLIVTLVGSIIADKCGHERLSIFLTILFCCVGGGLVILAFIGGWIVALGLG